MRRIGFGVTGLVFLACVVPSNNPPPNYYGQRGQQGPYGQQQSGYPQQPGYPHQPGYPPQPGYPQQPGYPPQPGYPQRPGYPQQPGDPPPPGYPQQPGDPQQPPPPPGYPQQPGYPPQQPGYPQPAYPTHQTEAAARVVHIEAWGHNDSTGTGVKWNSQYPHASFDDDPRRGGKPNAEWDGSYDLRGDQLCVRASNLRAPYTPTQTLSLGYTVTIDDATFSDGSKRKTIIVHKFSGTPAAGPHEVCERLSGGSSVATTSPPPGGGGGPVQSGAGTSFEVPTTGGTFEVNAPGTPNHGVRITIPPGALSSPVKISIGSAPMPKGNVQDIVRTHPELHAALDRYVERVNATPRGVRLHPMWPSFIAADDKTLAMPPIVLQPEGTTFARPIQVSIPIQTTLPANTNQSSLLVIHESGGRWDVAKSVNIDRTRGRIDVELDHFSSLWECVVNTPRYIWNRPAMWIYDEVDKAIAGLPKDTPRKFGLALMCRDDQRMSTGADGMMSSWDMLMYLGYEGKRPKTPSSKVLKDWLQDVTARRRNKENVDLVTVEALFERALLETKGNVFGALVMCHDVLRDNRETPSVQNAMAPYLGQRGDDELGGRYHLFGAAVYGYAHAYHMENGSWHDVIRRFAKPWAVLEFEEGIVSGDIRSEPREFGVDKIGASLGFSLYKASKSRSALVTTLGIDLNDCPPKQRKPETPPPPTTVGSGSGKEYGVYVAKDYVVSGVVFVGSREEVENYRTCDVQYWGLDCKKTVIMADPNLRRISDPLPDRESAQKAYCTMKKEGKFDREKLRPVSQYHHDGC